MVVTAVYRADSPSLDNRFRNVLNGVPTMKVHGGRCVPMRIAMVVIIVPMRTMILHGGVLRIWISKGASLMIILEERTAVVAPTMIGSLVMVVVASLSYSNETDREKEEKNREIGNVVRHCLPLSQRAL